MKENPPLELSDTHKNQSGVIQMQKASNWESFDCFTGRYLHFIYNEGTSSYWATSAPGNEGGILTSGRCTPSAFSTNSYSLTFYDPDFKCIDCSTLYLTHCQVKMFFLQYASIKVTTKSVLCLLTLSEKCRGRKLLIASVLIIIKRKHSFWQQLQKISENEEARAISRCIVSKLTQT